MAGEHNAVVTPDLAVSFLGLDSARVLGTPYLILLIEMTARNSIKPLLDEGFDSVGLEVNVRHLAATPLGMRVRIRTETLEADGRRVRLKVEAWDDREKIAEGVHERFIINVARFAERVAAKRTGA
ncbi:MAG: thioesterase family protein [Acidobacteria bacterium]|nr:thioesterase family protein [Acidobacteriota bacterium]